MLKRRLGYYYAICDWCGDKLDTETIDWQEARELTELEGWRAMHDGVKWRDYCLECLRKLPKLKGGKG